MKAINIFVKEDVVKDFKDALKATSVYNISTDNKFTVLDTDFVRKIIYRLRKEFGHEAIKVRVCSRLHTHKK